MKFIVHILILAQGLAPFRPTLPVPQQAGEVGSRPASERIVYRVAWASSSWLFVRYDGKGRITNDLLP